MTFKNKTNVLVHRDAFRKLARSKDVFGFSDMRERRNMTRGRRKGTAGQKERKKETEPNITQHNPKQDKMGRAKARHALP